MKKIGYQVLTTVFVLFAAANVGAQPSRHATNGDTRGETSNEVPNQKYLSQCATGVPNAKAPSTPTKAGGSGANEALFKEVDEIFKKPRPTKSCATCHNPASTEGSSKFSDILNRDELIAKKIIDLENPEKSKIHIQLLDDSMPLEGDKLSQAEKDKVLAWIKATPEKEKETDDVGFISENDKLLCILKDLRTLPQDDRPYIRYFSLNHLYNSKRFGEMSEARVGLDRLLNSLTLKDRLKLSQQVDGVGTLMRIDLRDYNFDSHTWDLVLNKNPYGVILNSNSAREAYQMVKTNIPEVRADWFTFAASKPPLYSDILGLPKNNEPDAVRKFEALVNAVPDLHRFPEENFSVGVRVSGVSNNNRFFNRVPTVDPRNPNRANGYLYASSDFATSEARQNIFEHPIDFEKNGGEFIASIPKRNDKGERMNAQVYLLANAKDQNLDEVPSSLNIVSHKRRPRNSFNVINGQSCFDCHDKDAPGIINPKANPLADHVNSHFNEFLNLGRDTKFAKELLKNFKTQTQIDPIYEKDRNLYKKFQEETGGIPGAIFSTAAHFEDDLDEARVAAELGQTLEAFRNHVASNPELNRKLAFSSTGVLPRNVFQKEFKNIAGLLSLGAFPNPANVSLDVGFVLQEAKCQFDFLDSTNGFKGTYESVLKFSVSLLSADRDEAQKELDKEVDRVCLNTCNPEKVAVKAGTKIANCKVTKRENSRSLSNDGFVASISDSVLIDRGVIGPKEVVKEAQFARAQATCQFEVSNRSTGFTGTYQSTLKFSKEIEGGSNGLELARRALKDEVANVCNNTCDPSKVRPSSGFKHSNCRVVRLDPSTSARDDGFDKFISDSVLIQSNSSKRVRESPPRSAEAGAPAAAPEALPPIGNSRY